MWNNAEKIWLKLIAAKQDWKNILICFEDCSYSNQKCKRLLELFGSALPALSISASSRRMLGRQLALTLRCYMCCLNFLSSNLKSKWGCGSYVMYYHNFTGEFICSRYHDILHVIVMVRICVPYFTSALHAISFDTHICTKFCMEHMCTIAQNWEFKIVTSTELWFTWTPIAMSNQASVTQTLLVKTPC